MNRDSTVRDLLEHMGSTDNTEWNHILDEYSPLNGTLSPTKNPSIKWSFWDIIDEDKEEPGDIILSHHQYYEFTCTLVKPTSVMIKDVPAWVSPIS